MTGQERDRVRGALVGLAIGDAAGWPAALHRSHRLVDWTRRVRITLDRFAEDHRLTTLPVPFALNQPVEPLRLGAADDAEWVGFTGQMLLASTDDPRVDRSVVEAAWRDLANGDDRVWARLSVRTALDNLRRGLPAPMSGHDNPHHFDDAAAVRAVAVGARYAGDPARAVAVATIDAAVTHSGDGVCAARAVAAAVAVACGGGDLAGALDAALAQLPDDTALGRDVRVALTCAAAVDSAFDLVPVLDHDLLDHVYSYGVAAADTLAVAFAMAVAAGGRLAEAVPPAACLARTADSAPALAGALCGAVSGFATLPARWIAASRRLVGCCLPQVAGLDLVDLADRLAAVSAADRGHPTTPARTKE